MKKVNVYLAGGFKGGWQDKVKDSCKNLQGKGLVKWQDPRENNTKDPSKYGPMDRERIDRSEIVFGYAEKSNPLPFPLFFEIGYALGKGKLVIFVNEITEDDSRYRPYLFASVFGSGQIYTEIILENGMAVLRNCIRDFADFYKRQKSKLR